MLHPECQILLVESVAVLNCLCSEWDRTFHHRKLLQKLHPVTECVTRRRLPGDSK